MKNREYRKLLKMAAVALLIAAPLLVLPQTTHALSLLGGLDLSPAGIATGIFRVIAYVFNFLFGLLYLLGSYLVQVALQVNNQILNSQNQIVTIGWTILRDVANLGFVLVMIIVAVATIIRYEKFSAKALLPKLIAAAIIVNFSLTIAGAFIVFANSLTQVFLAGKLGTDPATAISVAFEPQALYLPPQNPPPPNPADQGSAASGFSTAVLTGIAGLVFSMVFTLIAALVMFALALMLIIRYVFLSILLLTAPITWLFWVFPPLSDIFHTWWKKFMQWVFFLPAVAFFIYLAMTSVQFFDGMNINTANAVGGTLGIVFDQGIKMILLCGLMLGGLIVAQNMGIAGAAGAMKIATGAGNAAKKWAKSTSQRMATAPLRTQTGRNVVGGMQKFGQNLPRGLKWLGAPVRGAGGAIAQQRAKAEKQVADAGKKLPKNLKEQAQQYAQANNAKRVAIASNLLKEKGKRDKSAKTANNKRTNADEALQKAQADYDKYTIKTPEMEATLAKAKNDRDEIYENTKDAISAAADMEEIMAQLPKQARKTFEDAGLKLGRTRLGRAYGQTESKYFTTPGKTEKIEEAIKAVSEEGGEEEGASKPAGGETTKKP